MAHTTADEAPRLLVSMVEKWGGIEKSRELLEGFRQQEQDPAGYVRRVAAHESDAGPKQLFALAVLGLSLAVYLYPALKRESEAASRRTETAS